jgi:hypothetical protein
MLIIHVTETLPHKVVSPYGGIKMFRKNRRNIVNVIRTLLHDNKYIHYNTIITGKLGPAYCRNAGTGGGGYLCCGGPEVPVPCELANLCAIAASITLPPSPLIMSLTFHL